ncbi:MAG: imelysin family protein [Bradymonadaceae bacterium]
MSIAGCDRSDSASAPDTSAPASREQTSGAPPDSPLDAVPADLQCNVLVHYANLAEAVFRDAAERGETLVERIKPLRREPTEDELADARGAWVEARRPFVVSRVFRTDGAPSPTQRLGRHLPGPPTPASQVDGPAREGTGDVGTEATSLTGDDPLATNFHAIEFLLWGPDTNAHGPGQRPVSDFRLVGASSLETVRRRRNALLSLASWHTEDLHELANAWSSGPASPAGDQPYRAEFLDRDRSAALTQILDGVTGLLRHLAETRLRRLLEKAPDRPTVSRFSDTTHRELVVGTRALLAVYTGSYRRSDGTRIDGPGLERLVAALAPDIDERCHDQFDATLEAVRALPQPLDRAVRTEAGRRAIERAADELDRQREIFEAIEKQLGL